MPRVFLFSDLYLPTFPYLEIPMYRYLEGKGVNVTYVLQTGDIRLTNSELSNVFSKLNLLILDDPRLLYKYMSKGDLLLSRFAYKLLAGEVATKVRAMKHKILMYDPSGIDIRVRACPAQYLTAKSEPLRLATLKKFKKHYRGIFVTGTIHNDAAAITTVDKKDFMESYGLDSSKKFVILTPANPGEMGHQHGIDSEYTEIINIVKSKCPNYEIAVKAHPLDYTANMKAQPGIVHKNEHYGGSCSWEQFYPGITVIAPHEGYKAIKACDTVLNVRSSIAMETALFKTPLININRSKYTTNWPFDSNIMIDIEMGELAATLGSDNYSADENKCLEYVKREAFSNDGKAYERTADVAIKILNF